MTGNKKGLYLLIFLLVLFTGFLSACKSNQDKPRYTIGFSQCIGSDKWRITMLEEMRRELSFYSDIGLVYEDAGGNSNKQIEQVKSLLNKNVDLLIISPNESEPLTPIVEQAFSQGTPVVVIDRKISSNFYTAYVGADNFEVGRMAGEYLAHRLKEKGNIIEVTGLTGSSPAIERNKGFKSALKRYPSIKVIKQLSGSWLNRKAQEEVNLNKHLLSQTDAIFAHNDQMALGTYRVLKNNGFAGKIKLVGVDALPGKNNGLEFVSGKIFDASMLYPTGGKEAIRTALNILNKSPYDKNTTLKSVVIDSSNVELMVLQADKMTSQQKDIEKQQNMLAEQKIVYNNQQVILNILVVSLVLAIVFAGIAFYSLNENWKNNKRLEHKNHQILEKQSQLIEMSEKARSATEAKFNFFTNISHEFRTPLTLILIPLEELLANAKLPQKTRSHLQLINRNVMRLLRMVNQLIDFRKIDYEKMRVRATENNLLAFTKEIIDLFKDIAYKRNIDLRLVSSESHLNAWFDTNMLDKVLFNLLSNAFKFTHDSGKIIVTVEKNIETNSVELKVEDNGAGMDEHTLTHAFDLFYQDDSKRSKGSGLGLSLSKEMILLHKGSIKVNSQKEKGACFVIQLPLGDTHLHEDEKVHTPEESTLDYDNIKIYTTELEDTANTADSPSPQESLKERSILIIEDNEELLNFLKEKFSSQYDTFTANNGNSGLHQAFENIPDIIISDIVLPAQSGTDITQALKNDIRTSHIPIILLTAQGSQEQQIKGLKTMADAYITKPFNLQYLDETVKNLLHNRNLLRSRFSSELPVGSKLPASRKLDKKFLNEFASIVETNIPNESFNVDDICKSMGMSRIQLYRKAKALLDCTITDYILNRRLQKAKYLLLNEDFSISEITYQVGVASPTYFSTVFKAKYGCSPTEYRRKKKENRQ